MREEAGERFFSTDFAKIMREIFIHLMNAVPEEMRRSDAFFAVSGTPSSTGIAPQVRRKIEKVYRSQAAFTPKSRANFLEIHWIALHVHDMVLEAEGQLDLVSFLKMSNQELLEGARNVRATHES